MSKRGALFVLLVLVSAQIAFRYHQTQLPTADIDVAIENLPMNLGHWQGHDVHNLGEREKNILKLDKSLRRIYTNERGMSVFLYVGYWKKQSGEYQAAKHSPTVCLPANGWRIHEQAKREIEFVTRSGTPALITTRLLADINSKTSVFYYWFFRGEKTYADDWQSLWSTSTETFFHGRSDGGIVEVSTDVAVINPAKPELLSPETTVKDFLSDFYPVFRGLLLVPKTSNH